MPFNLSEEEQIRMGLIPGKTVSAPYGAAQAQGMPAPQAQGMQSSALRGDLQQRIEAYTPQAPSPESIQLSNQAIEQAAPQAGADIYNKKKWRGGGLGMIAAPILNKMGVGGIKTREEYAEDYKRQGLTKARADRLATKEASLEKARQKAYTEVFGEQFDSRAREENAASAMAKQGAQNEYTDTDRGEPRPFWNTHTGEEISVQTGRDGNLYYTGTDKEADIKGFTSRFPEGAKEKNDAKSSVTSFANELAGSYFDLMADGAAVSGDQDAMTNLTNAFRSTSLVAAAERAVGTDAAAIRSRINQTRPLLLQAIRQATEMGVRGMDTPQELNFYLQAASDPQVDIASNLAALSYLNDQYGLGDSASDQYKNLMDSKAVLDARASLKEKFKPRADTVDDLSRTGGLNPQVKKAPPPRSTDPELDAMKEELERLKRGGT